MKNFKFQTINQISLLLVLAILILVSTVNYLQSNKAIKLQGEIRDVHNNLLNNTDDLNKRMHDSHLFFVRYLGEQNNKSSTIDLTLSEFKSVVQNSIISNTLNKNTSNTLLAHISRVKRLFYSYAEEESEYPGGESALGLKELIDKELKTIQIVLLKLKDNSILGVKRISLTLVRDIEDMLESYSETNFIEVHEVESVLSSTLIRFKTIEKLMPTYGDLNDGGVDSLNNLYSEYIKQYKYYYTMINVILYSDEDASSEYILSVHSGIDHSWPKLQEKAKVIHEKLSLALQFEIDETTNFLKSSRNNSMYAAVSGIFLVVILMVVFNKILSSRVNTLKRGAEKYARGLWDDKIYLECNDGFADLAIQFNYMADEIKLREVERQNINLTLEDKIQEIQESQLELDKAQILAKMGHWRLNISDMTICFSKNLRDIYGLSELNHDKVKIKDFFELLDCNDANQLGSLISKSIEDGGDGKTEFTWGKKVKNKSQYFELNWKSNLGADNKPIELRGISQDVTARKTSEETIIHQAYYDQLTKLPNRRLFKERLKQAMQANISNEKLMSIIFIDCDRFKPINDTLGHHIGDELLCSIGDRLKDCVRTNDMVCRVSGDEFAILLEDIKHVDEINSIANKIISATAEPHQLMGHRVFATVSAGISIFPFDDSREDDLLIFADMAMYYSKKNGGNQFTYYNYDMNKNNSSRLELELELREALENDELQLYYQPQNIIDNENKMVGVEALLRWNHPKKGLVSPLDFIPIAEETGLIIKIGEWVIRTACEQAVAWKHQGYGEIRIGINLSPRQFNQPNLPELVQSIISATGITPAQVDLEITETISMKNIETTINTLNEFKKIGVHISLDDFGTGYSSLSYLQKMPIDTLKIDRAFIMNLHESETDQVFVRTIISMAHSLGMEVVAEGVENEKQLKLLHGMKCNIAQGYWFSPPVPVDKLSHFLSALKNKENDSTAA